jgi:BCD family chlorophyll transporter-like MFS transporter
MFLFGMGISALIIGWLLRDFSSLVLIRVVQGAAIVGLLLTLIALWKQESVNPLSKEDISLPKPAFRLAWSDLMKSGQTARLIGVVFLGTIAFNMQDVLLEPFGGEVLSLSVGKTTWLTASWALGALLGLAYAAHRLDRNGDTTKLMRGGLLVGLVAFPIVILSAPLGSALLFFIGALLIGFGAGLFFCCYFNISNVNAHLRHSWPRFGNWCLGCSASHGCRYINCIGRFLKRLN